MAVRGVLVNTGLNLDSYLCLHLSVQVYKLYLEGFVFFFVCWVNLCPLCGEPDDKQASHRAVRSSMLLSTLFIWFLSCLVTLLSTQCGEPDDRQETHRAVRSPPIHRST